MLFGRDSERAHLEQLLDTVESGPVACVLEGAAGIGKTTLWRDAVESARRRGYHVLETAPSEPDAVLAFSGLGDLFELLGDQVIDALPDVQARALRAALFLSELPDSSGELQALPRAILGLLRQVSATGPAVIAIDDEQWLDPASARVLAFALCRLRDERIVVIVARRSEATGTLSVELDRRFGGRGVDSLSLDPLPMGAIKTLLEARLGRTISAPVLRRINQVAGGNPLWALAIALELDARGSGGDRAGDLPIPRTLSDAIELRLRHLDPGAGDAMLVIAALSQPTLAMVQAAIPGFALSDLESAERAGVIEISGGRVRFTHALLASTHYARAPVSKRRELHRRLATVIEDEEERAQHVALGAEAPDRDLADGLERAAGVAARRGANESAAQLLEDAARLTPIDQSEAQSARIVAAAEHRFKSGEVSRARYMLGELLPDLPAGPLRARARLRLAGISAERPRVATELLEAALADAVEDDRLRVEIEWELTGATMGVGRIADARAYAESAVRTTERLGDPDLLARARGEMLVTFVVTGEPMPEGLVAQLSDTEDSAAATTYNQPSTAIGFARHWAGELEDARPMLELAVQRALSRGEEWDQLGLLLALVQLEWDLGNHAMAEQHRRTADDLLGEYAEGFLWLLLLDAKSALDTGDLTAARGYVERGLAVAEETAAVWQTSRCVPVLAAVELLEGRPDVAHDLLEDQREWTQSHGFGPAGYGKAITWSLDIEALVALDRLDEAERLVVELRSRAELCRSDAVRALALRGEGLLLAARGDLVAAIGAIDRAVAAHMRQCRPLEYGRTLVEKGSLERRARRKAAAKQTLEQAMAILEPLGAQIWVSRARDELSRIGLRRSRATEGLTPAQARVAELVAAGMTNAEVARELHMSLRTVESHLSRVYREHGVTSRSQLAAALAASRRSFG
jgi:DNA-binding CsgD family transcriptional regulator